MAGVKKVVIATPMYGGVCQGAYMKSVISLIMEFSKNNIKVELFDMYNESLINRARNTLTEAFLRSDGDYLLFIDADESFNAPDIVKMVETGLDLIGAPVPLKGINWDGVRKAAENNSPDLSQHTSIFNINTLPGSKQKFDQNKPYEVSAVGTGLMLISRKCLEDMAKVTKKYKFNINPIFGINMGDEINNFWDLSISDDGVLLSEDYHFCRTWRELGNKIYIAPWVKVVHHGNYAFN